MWESLFLLCSADWDWLGCIRAHARVALLEGVWGLLHVEGAASVGAASLEWGPPGFMHLLRVAWTPTFFPIDKWGDVISTSLPDLGWLSGWCLSGAKRKNGLWCPCLPKGPEEGWFLGGPASPLLPLLHQPLHTLKRERGYWLSRLWKKRGTESQGPPFLAQKPSGVKPWEAIALSRHPQLVLVCPHGLWWEHWARVPSEGGHRHA